MNRLEQKAQSVGMRIATELLRNSEGKPGHQEKVRALGVELKKELLHFADAILELQAASTDVAIEKALRSSHVSTS